MILGSFLRSSLPKVSPVLAAVGLIGLAANAPAAHAQANLIFTGGSGTPLTLTLVNPVVYTIMATAPSTPRPFFVLKNVGNLGGTFGVSGTITYRINSGAIQTINTLDSDFTGGTVVGTDASLYGSFSGVNANDIVTLLSGTLTTTGNITAARPANGSYVTTITQGNGTLLSGNGVAVTAAPEPASLALIGVGLFGLLIRTRRKASQKVTLTA